MYQCITLHGHAHFIAQRTAIIQSFASFDPSEGVEEKGAIESLTSAPEHVWSYRRQKSHNILTNLAGHFVEKVFNNGNYSAGTRSGSVH